MGSGFQLNQSFWEALREDTNNFFLVVGPLRGWGINPPPTTKQKKHFFLKIGNIHQEPVHRVNKVNLIYSMKRCNKNVIYEVQTEKKEVFKR